MHWKEILTGWINCRHCDYCWMISVRAVLKVCRSPVILTVDGTPLVYKRTPCTLWPFATYCLWHSFRVSVVNYQYVVWWRRMSLTETSFPLRRASSPSCSSARNWEGQCVSGLTTDRSLLGFCPTTATPLAEWSKAPLSLQTSVGACGLLGPLLLLTVP